MEINLRQREAKSIKFEKELKNREQSLSLENEKLQNEWNQKKYDLQQLENTIQERFRQIEAHERAIVQERERPQRNEAMKTNDETKEHQQLNLYVSLHYISNFYFCLV